MACGFVCLILGVGAPSVRGQPRDLPSTDEVFARAQDYLRSLRTIQYEASDQSGRLERFAYDNGRYRVDVFEPGTDPAGISNRVTAFDGVRFQRLRSRGINRVLMVSRQAAAHENDSELTPLGYLYLWLVAPERGFALRHLQSNETWQSAKSRARLLERAEVDGQPVVRVEVVREDTRRRFEIDFDEGRSFMVRSYRAFLIDGRPSGSCRATEVALVGRAGEQIPFPAGVMYEQPAGDNQLALEKSVLLRPGTLKINEPLVDVDFTVTPPAGTEVLDGDLLDRRGEAAGNAPGAAVAGQPAGGSRTWLIIGLNAAVLAGAMGLMVWRRMRRRS